MEPTVASRLEQLRSTLPENVTLVAVSKNQSVDTILQTYAAGQRIFGENKAQSLISKAPALPSDIQWHFIGHLQTNKVKAIIPWVQMIHSVDSGKLFKEIEKAATMAEKHVEILLQFHIAEETSKYGFSLAEAELFLSDDQVLVSPYVGIAGVMGMATFTEDADQIIREFKALKTIFHTLQARYFSGNPDFRQLSMGMSDDYPLAIAQGATMVRIGSAIFSS